MGVKLALNPVGVAFVWCFHLIYYRWCTPSKHSSKWIHLFHISIKYRFCLHSTVGLTSHSIHATEHKWLCRARSGGQLGHCSLYTHLLPHKHRGLWCIVERFTYGAVRVCMYMYNYSNYSCGKVCYLDLLNLNWTDFDARGISVSRKF